MATPNEHGHPITALDRGAWVTIITALMMTYMILFHLARLLIRYTINGPFGSDDHVISVGVVFAIVHSALKFSQANAGLGKSISIVDHSRIEQIQKTGYTADIFYLIALTLSKCGTLLLICRVTRMKKHLYPAYIACGFTAAWGLASILALSIRCDMPHPWQNPTSCSSDLYTRWLAIDIIGTAIEILTVSLPVYLVWNLHMSFASKCVVVFAFSFRFPVIVTAILHIFYVHKETSSTDPLLYGAASSVCMEACLHYSLMAATIPCMKPFIKSFNTGFLSHKADQGVYGSSNDHGSGNYQLSTINSSKRNSRYRSAPKRNQIGVMTSIEPNNEAKQDESRSISEDGSDKMIIRRTTAWDVRYDQRGLLQRHDGVVDVDDSRFNSVVSLSVQDLGKKVTRCHVNYGQSLRTQPRTSPKTQLLFRNLSKKLAKNPPQEGTINKFIDASLPIFIKGNGYYQELQDAGTRKGFYQAEKQFDTQLSYMEKGFAAVENLDAGNSEGEQIKGNLFQIVIPRTLFPKSRWNVNKDHPETSRWEDLLTLKRHLKLIS